MSETISAAIDVRGVSVSYGDATVLESVDLEVDAGSVVSLLGPSGCGKTTLLRAIAGLEPVGSGEIRVGGTVVSGPGVHLAAERRRVGMVFQDWALFPHLSVRKNVAYGLARSKRSGPRADDVLEMVDLADLADRQPHTLSGGQQQRVALARALAPEPSVLLLDEPFSNLDTTLRVEIRSEVHRLLSALDVTSVFVTHDQDEAFVLGDRVAVMTRGRIVQLGHPAELYARPASPWVAAFVGEANLVPGVVSGKHADTFLGPVPVDSDIEGHAEILVRPEDLALTRLVDGVTPSSDGPTGGGDGAVSLVEYYGHDTTYEVALGDGTVLRARLTSAPRYERGDRVVVRYVGGPTIAYAPTR
ncbi:MAG: ABC transporter ATP-binding protein [Acidimicrobiia bacterium]|nr:ABC transporter ATP-binding protein [Acidimicrobiia bacterium]